MTRYQRSRLTASVRKLANEVEKRARWADAVGCGWQRDLFGMLRRDASVSESVAFSLDGAAEYADIARRLCVQALRPVA